MGRKKNLVDLTGKRFGKLVVVKKGEDYITPSNGVPIKRWICICDCGRETSVREPSLTSGRTRSCGCNVMLTSREALSWIFDKRVVLPSSK
jgi:hypothetical protein